MSSNLGNIAATVSLNIDPFQQSARVLETQMRSINKALEASELAWKNNSKNINAQKAQYELTGKAIQVNSAQLENQKKKYEALKKEIGDVNTASAQQKTDLLSIEAAMNKTSIEIEKLTEKQKTLARQIAINESSWTKSGEALENFGTKTTKVGEGLSSFGEKWTKGVTAPIVAGVTAVTAASISWESAFAGVLKTNDEVVDKNGKVVYSYKDLEDGLRGLAKELPTAHSEIAATAEAAGQLGIQTENVVSFTKTMLDMGESTNMSAETAATALARFANITQMSQKDFDRLGSVVVDLGNNFATTEQEIVDMGLRLAGAGAQIGMTEGEIMGFASALSSVGIEAAAGGSAFSKVMINMQLATETGITAFDELKAMAGQAGYTLNDVYVAVREGGKAQKELAAELGLTSTELGKMYREADKSAIALKDFADVAGMTNLEFAQLFQENPAEAIMKFVVGLSKAEEQGISTIKVLNDMDIKEIRLRDSLLRAANASGVFEEAIKTGNIAWEENTALTEEASKRYETTESKLKMLRNEVVDVAIDLGGPFVDALRSGLESAKPLIEALAQLAQKFSDANPETQQAIVKFLGLAAAIGPVSSVLGGFLKITGGGITTVGKMAKGIGVLSGTAKASKLGIDLATTGVLGLGSGATTALGTSSAGVLGLAGGLGTIAVPAGIALGAIGLVTGAVILGKKAYDDHQLAGAKWGTEVTKEQDKVIESSLELRDQATAHVNAFSDGVTGSAEKVVEANQSIVDSIQAVVDKEYERAQENISKIENEKIAAVLKEQAERDKRINEQMVKNAQERVDSINEIMLNASENNRELSTQERLFIEANYKQLSTKQLEVAGFTKAEIVAIESAYQADLTEMTTKQLQERSLIVRNSLDEERASYNEQKQAIIDVTENNTRLQKEMLEELDLEHKKNTESQILGYARLLEAQGVTLEEASGLWEQWGWTVDEVNQLVSSSAQESTSNLEMFAQGITESDLKWNEMALDPKTGEVKTNMVETLLEMASTKNGWEELIFIAKNADLTTNAKEEIAIAIGAQNNWSNLSFVEKNVLVNNDEAMLRLYDSMNELGMWNQYYTDRKMIGADNADFMYKTFESMGALKTYNSMSTDLKKLLADGPAKLKINEAENALAEFNNLPEDEKVLLADNKSVKTQITAAQELIISYNRNTKPDEKKMNASTNAWTVASSAQRAIDAVKGKTVYIDTVHRETKSPKRATGDPYFQGGPVILGDGGRPEPFLTPSGRFGISPNTDTMYNLERGTKIWPSISKMLETLPHYKNGTQFDDTKLSRFVFNRGENNQQKETKTIQNFFQFDKLIWQGKEDIRKTLEEMAFVADVDARGGM